MIVLQGVRVRLRPVVAGDVEARFALGADGEIFRMFGASRADAKPFTRDAAESWVKQLENNPHAWAIEVEGRLVGEIRLHGMSVQDRRASMAIGIYAPTLLGLGIGTEAIHLLLRHAFTELKLHRIGVRVLAYNDRAIRAYSKCGFVLEGRERETAFVDGKWHDDLIMGLISADYESQFG
ncbi:RimJ/RimL family protein N-acetyltransferase [Agrobacterium larrymoorei]|uniref:RimJ/RimL family protein N-acetyltransferase n=1 Tax=Agrobacterium larrymoorei TaxID=160699 RepID=A0AAJ2BAJ4_9HYPH|nr:GNAT family protein [Agrobacterium larrymoorei]MDR6103393.1 RimJ/RimL family protein N-acetyltransferase [Agrobacterium larrymoorei]